MITLTREKGTKLFLEQSRTEAINLYYDFSDIFSHLKSAESTERLNRLFRLLAKINTQIIILSETDMDKTLTQDCQKQSSEVCLMLCDDINNQMLVGEAIIKRLRSDDEKYLK